MCWSELESCFDLDSDEFYLIFRKLFTKSVIEFGVYRYHSDLSEIGGCDYYVFRLSLKCDDYRIKNLLEGLMDIPLECYFRILKSTGNVLGTWD